MILPRQLTWLHLLPAHSAFDCRSAPTWLREPLAQRSAAGGAPTVVASDHPAGEPPPNLNDAAAFVGVNCRGVSDRSLRDAGFSLVRRYAVLPGWDNPRWFIPLASPQVSSARFDLYTPPPKLSR